MPSHPFREAGLPPLYNDAYGHRLRTGFYKGTVQAVYPDLYRVDIAPDEGGLVAKALVMNDAFPEVHVDTENPQHAYYTFMGGHLADPICWIAPWRRLAGPDATTGDDKERHFYHKNQQVRRVKDITVRITPDNKFYVYESEEDDYAMYDMNERTFHVITPHNVHGTDDGHRLELHAEGLVTDQARLVMPQYFLGKFGTQDTDGITYLADQLLHLVSVAIKLTASSSITLDPPQINLGAVGASEPIILGNLFQTFLNAFLTLFNAHVHTSVQTGAGVSGPPQTATGLMPNSTLSTIARVSQ